MNILTINSIMESGFTYLSGKMNNKPGEIEYPPFLRALNSITRGFIPGQLTVIKDFGKGNTAFIFSLLYDYVVKNNIYTYLISNKYTKEFVSLNLLKYGFQGYHNILSRIFDEEDLTDIKNYYKETKKDRKEKGFDETYPLYFSRFHEYEINEICGGVKGFLQLVDSNEKKEKKLAIITDIAYEDLRQIKELAERSYIPIIVFMTNEKRHSSYADVEFELRENSLSQNEYWTKEIPYKLSVINNTTLVEGELELSLETTNCSFNVEEEKESINWGEEVISQEEVNEVLEGKIHVDLDELLD